MIKRKSFQLMRNNNKNINRKLMQNSRLSLIKRKELKDKYKTFGLTIQI